MPSLEEECKALMERLPIADNMALPFYPLEERWCTAWHLVYAPWWRSGFLSVHSKTLSTYEEEEQKRYAIACEGLSPDV